MELRSIRIVFLSDDGTREETTLGLLGFESAPNCKDRQSSTIPIHNTTLYPLQAPGSSEVVLGDILRVGFTTRISSPPIALLDTWETRRGPVKLFQPANA
jgi:hypothetical protein